MRFLPGHSRDKLKNKEQSLDFKLGPSDARPVLNLMLYALIQIRNPA